jgi:cytochrome oxidase Cu insertion factor (SCO1/SenC/PrrC family)
LCGQKFQLADYRGKFVLLNLFFVGYQGASDLPQLKDAFEAYGKNDHLAMLSVGYTPAAPLNEFARTHGITWTHGIVGNLSIHTEFADYLQFAPDSGQSQLNFLIAPEGKIVAKGLHGAAIKEAVAKALPKR